MTKTDLFENSINFVCNSVGHPSVAPVAALLPSFDIFDMICLLFITLFSKSVIVLIEKKKDI